MRSPRIVSEASPCQMGLELTRHDLVGDGSAVEAVCGSDALVATGALTKMTTALGRHIGRSTNRKGH